MSLRTNVFRSLAIGFSTSACLAISSLQVHATPINYGDFGGSNVTFLQVTEDSSTGDLLPLYGSPFVGGDALDFDPSGLAANAGGAAGVDLTDGQLKFGVVAHQGKAITKISVNEAGDTTLIGFGTDLTMSSVTAHVFLEIEEVDGVAIAPINVMLALNFSPSGGDYGLQTDAGGGPFYNTAWTGSGMIDLSQVLDSHNVSYLLGATRVSVNLDNTLGATSEAGTQSFISKKDFDVSVMTGDGKVPEPACLSLIGLLTGISGRRRKA